MSRLGSFHYRAPHMTRPHGAEPCAEPCAEPPAMFRRSTHASAAFVLHRHESAPRRSIGPTHVGGCSQEVEMHLNADRAPDGRAPHAVGPPQTGPESARRESIVLDFTAPDGCAPKVVAHMLERAIGRAHQAATLTCREANGRLNLLWWSAGELCQTWSPSRTPTRPVGSRQPEPVLSLLLAVVIVAMNPPPTDAMRVVSAPACAAHTGCDVGLYALHQLLQRKRRTHGCG